MPRGGKRQGTPGKAYSNRTDMASNYQNAGASAAAGGIAPPPATPPPAPIFASPEDSPNLLDPTNNPDQPITDGLAYGPGRGPEALNNDPRMAETKDLRKWLPLLDPVGDDPETPDSVRTLIRYIRGA